MGRFFFRLFFLLIAIAISIVIFLTYIGLETDKFDDLIKNKTSKLKLPEGLKDYSQNEETFSIEEFNFNLMPGPFLDGLDITKDLLQNNNLDNIFN